MSSILQSDSFTNVFKCIRSVHPYVYSPRLLTELRIRFRDMNFILVHMVYYTDILSDNYPLFFAWQQTVQCSQLFQFAVSLDSRTSFQYTDLCLGFPAHLERMTEIFSFHSQICVISNKHIVYWASKIYKLSQPRRSDKQQLSDEMTPLHRSHFT
jgi:hypothetical protein